MLIIFVWHLSLPLVLLYCWSDIMNGISCVNNLTTVISMQVSARTPPYFGRCDLDTLTYAAITIVIRLQFDYDNNCQNYHSTRRSGHHDSMLVKAWIHTRVTRRHFTSEVCEKAIPTSTIERCYPMFIRQRECHSYYYRDVHYCVIICPDRCLLIGYDASRRDVKMNMFIFHRGRIEVESKSNHNCNSRFSVTVVVVSIDVTFFFPRLGVELAISRSQVRCPNHRATHVLLPVEEEKQRSKD